MSDLVPSCQLDTVDPEWWVGEHGSFAHHSCSHSYAQHICLTHCPVLQKCARWADTQDWVGTTVIAGQIITQGRGGKKVIAEAEPVVCFLCDPEKDDLKGIELVKLPELV